MSSNDVGNDKGMGQIQRKLAMSSQPFALREKHKMGLEFLSL
jgi:hypothetical protein